MIFEKTAIEGVLIIQNTNLEDHRGSFTKIFNKNFFKLNNIDFDIRESYYSISQKNVIRGMHFQIPPFEHEKIVYVANGEIIDVILDLRKRSTTYGMSISVNLSLKNKKSVFIPKGCAHGFKSLKNNTITIYSVGTEYKSEFDCGINYKSFDFNWGKSKEIISERDKSFVKLENFKSPF